MALRPDWRRGAAALGAANALTLQFGGASGTLAALGDKGTAVRRALAVQLKLASRTSPGMPSGAASSNRHHAGGAFGRMRQDCD